MKPNLATAALPREREGEIRTLTQCPIGLSGEETSLILGLEELLADYPNLPFIP